MLAYCDLVNTEDSFVGLHIGTVPESLTQLISVVKKSQTFSVWLWGSIEAGQSHQTEPKAVNLGTVAAKWCGRNRHCWFCDICWKTGLLDGVLQELFILEW